MLRLFPRALGAVTTGAFALLAAFSAACPATATATDTAIGGGLLGRTATTVHLLPGAAALPKGLTAQSWIVADLDTGAVLAARSPHAKHLPASTIKALTAITLLPLVPKDTQITAVHRDVDLDRRSSLVGVVEGWTYTADDLYRGMLMVSGNDAAMTLTEPVGGPDRALQLMNEEAHHLQAFDTDAQTVNGLDENTKGMSTSAYDLALIGRAGMRIPEFATYVQTISAEFPAPPKKWKLGQTKPAGKPTAFQMYTHDHLMTRYKGALGIKNGYTVAAGHTFVGAAERNGHRLIVATMKGQDYGYREAEALLDWGFANEGRVAPIGTLVDPIVPPAAVVPGASPSTAPSPSLSPTTAPATAEVAAAAAAAASVASSPNGPIALIGGIGGGVLLAGVAALWASRRRRDRRHAAGEPDVDGTEGLAHPRGPEIVVPPTPAPIFTSNIRVVRSED